MAADNTNATLAGSIQKWFDKKSVDQDNREYETPLCNPAVGVAATIPQHGGTFMEFRQFEDFEPELETADDAPKLYAASSGDPSTGVTMAASVKQIPLAKILRKISLGEILVGTDPSDPVMVSKRKFRQMLKRWTHMVTNQSFVVPITDVSSFTDGTKLPGAFPTLYSQGAHNHAQLTADATFIIQDFKRAATILRNDGVPVAFGEGLDGLYAAYVDAAIWAQLEDDPKFAAMVERGYKTETVVGKYKYIDLYGCRFIQQSDPYRCKLSGEGGALTTRKKTGRVHVAHVLGKDAFAYLNLADKTARGMTTFKVQDITATGTEMTIGCNVPFRAAPLHGDRGINIAGCTAYDETIASLS